VEREERESKRGKIEIRVGPRNTERVGEVRKHLKKPERKRAVRNTSGMGEGYVVGRVEKRVTRVVCGEIPEDRGVGEG